MKRWMTMTFTLAALMLPAVGSATVPAEDHAAGPEFFTSNHAGYLGVGLKDVSDDRVAALKLKDARGVEVIALDHDGPAAKVGIREHDVILDMNGQEIASEEQLRRMLRETPAGRKAELTLSRDGAEVKVEVVLGDRAAAEHGAMAPPMEELNLQLEGLDNLVPANGVVELGDIGNDAIVFGANVTGANVEPLGAQLAQYFGAKNGAGVLVKDVRHDSAAAKAGLKAGDVIVRAAGQTVTTRVEWDRVTRENRGKTVSVEILREKRVQKLTITPPARPQGGLAAPSFEIEIGPAQEMADNAERARMMAEMTALQNPATQAEFDKEMNEASAEMGNGRVEMEKAVDEMKREIASPEFQKQLGDAQKQAADAVAAWQKDGAGMKAEMAVARAEADKSAAEWQAQRPEIDRQLREAQKQMKQAAEQMRLHMTPMD